MQTAYTSIPHKTGLQSKHKNRMTEEFKDKKVLIGMPSYGGSVPAMTVSALLHLHKPCQCSFFIIERQRTDKCRDYFAKQCLSGGFDYLMMIDDDNPPPADALEVMLADDKDVVIAAIASRSPNPATNKFDLCAYYKTDIAIGDKTLAKYEFIEKFKEEGPLHKIDSGGCGCILIKRKVLETLAKKYEFIFEYGDVNVNGQRRTMSEDAEFGERVNLAGFEMWLDDRVQPIHIGAPQLIKWQNTH